MKPAHSSTSLIARFAALCASGLLLAAYLQGYHLLGLLALVPWLIRLERSRNWRSALCDGVLMSMIYALAGFFWFGPAVAAFTGLSSFTAMVLICLFAPIWQPQFWLYALSYGLARKQGSWFAIAIATAIWVISEWLIPKALGDTLAYGLAPALWLRQGADLAGAAGLTALLLLTNAACVQAWVQRRQTWRNVLTPAVIAVSLPLAMTSYGALRLRALDAYVAEPTPILRVGMVQTSLVNYEQRRKQQGSYAVVREVLDQHIALSKAAIEHHGAEALLWSETVYPTPYGHPRSADSAAFDHELKSVVESLRVPLLFGSYDVDEQGEYNAAILLDPARELTARYRKTRLFPFTERIPGALDYAWIRRLLPWTGTWQPGNGARVFPLSASDGRELNVVPLICLDDVDPMLAIEGARLGAQAIVNLSNDSWFSRYPQGMELHLAVAQFRSIETRLPQLRVTTNGYTAFIDQSGEVLARTKMGEQAVLAGAVPIRTAPTTLMTRWGNWLGPTALASLILLALNLLRKAVYARQKSAVPESSLQNCTTDTPSEGATTATFAAALAKLSRPARFAVILLQLTAALALAYLGLAMLLRSEWRVHSMQQIYVYLGMVLLPLALSWLLQRWHAKESATATLSKGKLAAFLDHAAVKFGCFPLLMALPAFRLHQIISFGSSFGEYLSFGAGAYLQGLGIWWASWSLGLMLWAALLRLLGEGFLWLVAVFRADLAQVWRADFQWLARLMFYLAVPIWFLLRVG